MINQYILLQKVLRDDNIKDKSLVLYNHKLSLSFRHAHTKVTKNNEFDLERKLTQVTLKYVSMHNNKLSQRN